MSYLIFSIFFLSTPAFKALQTPDMAPLMHEMTTGLIEMLTNETKDYRPSSVREIMNSSLRRQLMGNYDGQNHYYTHNDRVRACYSTSITYQTALRDVRRYFQVRWLYVDNLEFEVGYLTHEIIHRYQMVLELYQMTERRFMSNQNENFAWSSYMLYIYVNILEQCKAIIHLCNMLHELDAKYIKIKSKKAGVFDDYIDENDFKAGRQSNTTDVLARERLALQMFEKEQKRKQKREERERKKERNKMLKIGKTVPWKRPRPTKSKYHDIIYGWSIEDWW